MFKLICTDLGLGLIYFERKDQILDPISKIFAIALEIVTELSINVYSSLHSKY